MTITMCESVVNQLNKLLDQCIAAHGLRSLGSREALLQEVVETLEGDCRYRELQSQQEDANHDWADPPTEEDWQNLHGGLGIFCTRDKRFWGKDYPLLVIAGPYAQECHTIQFGELIVRWNFEGHVPAE